MPNQQAVARETIIALRARHQAHRIASDILYEEPIDVRVIHCAGCGWELDWRVGPFGDPLICSHCGAATPLPVYLRPYLMPPPDNWTLGYDLDAIQYAEEFKNDAMLRYEKALRWAERDVERQIPPWTTWFTLFMLGILLLAAFLAARM